MDKKTFNIFPFLSSVIAILLSGSYCLQRYPLALDYGMVVKVLCFSLALINLPFCLYLFNKRSDIDFYSFNISSVIVILSIFILMGFFNFSFLIFPLIIIGAGSFGLTLFLSFGSKNYMALLRVILLIFFCSWLSWVVWGGKYLTPFFLEKIITRSYNSPGGVDTFFHMSMAQMIKTYNFPSTGLDELPYIPYHYGSHFIFAQISKLLNISVIDIYHFGFPVIFLPLFFHICFIVLHQFKNLNGQTAHFDYFFWILIFVVFIGFFRIHREGLAFQTTLSCSSLLVSESYLVSMIFFIISLSILVVPILKEGDFKLSKVNLFLLIYLMILIGFSKISTLFILDVILFYLFIRYRLYRSIFSFFLLIGSFVTSITVFYFLYDPLAPSGSYEFLSYYKNFVNAGFFQFIILSFLWTFVLVGMWIFLRLSKIKINSILIELQIVIAVFGFLPGAFLKIAGGSAVYFSDIQHWTALLFIPFYYNHVVQSVNAKTFKYLRVIAFIGFLFCLNNCVYSFENIVKENFAMKSTILGKIFYADYVKTHEVIENRDVFFDKRINTVLEGNVDYRRLKYLASLDSMPHKEGKILHIQDMELLSKYLPCYKAPFFISAAAGMALFDGFSLKRCFYADYGVEYFTSAREFLPGQDVCKLICNPIFKEVIYINIAAQSYTVSSCKN